MAKTEAEIEIKKITNSGDNSRFSELFRKCFRNDKSADYFKWKYFDNPAGNIVGYEVVAKGKTVGSFGVTPEYYYLNGEKTKVFLCAEAMVAPRFWGKKLFEQMVIKVQADALSEENTFIIGFPNKLSYVEMTNNLGWQTLEKDCQYSFVLRQYFQIRHPFLSNSKLKISNLTKIDGELKNYLKLSAPTAKISKIFDADVFQWKIFNSQNHEYKVIGITNDNELLGICVYRRDTEKTCEISYLHFLEAKNYKKYLPLFIKHIFAESPIRYIHTWKSSKGVLADAYKVAGFMTNIFSKGPFRDTFPIIVYGKEINSAVDMTDFDNYEIQPILLDY